MNAARRSDHLSPLDRRRQLHEKCFEMNFFLPYGNSCTPSSSTRSESAQWDRICSRRLCTGIMLVNAQKMSINEKHKKGATKHKVSTCSRRMPHMGR